ncbi:ATP-dependent helicase [Patescibacteria group bacterium]|nr:MAG: ATP-dependent helicase [Patescibacteria group bacterium]
MKEFILQDNFDLSQASIDYQKELNPEQLNVVLNGNGACLVLAGAGSGKTRTITYRVAYLLERGVSPESILLVTFTNKAAKEMLSRVEGLLCRYPTGLWGGTFHSIANRLLRMYGSQLGYTNHFTILDQEDAKSLIKVCIKALDIDTTSRRFPSPAKVHAMISYAQNSGKGMSDVIQNRYPSFLEIVPVIERIAELYADRKRQADSMDFDDLLLKLRELLYHHEGVRQKLAHQFEYILVDEYQDTNVVQAQIIRQLASEHENVLVVGDDAQSIYSFRAAEIRNILGFPQTYADTKTFHLTTNYRSSPEILAVANSSIIQNKDQFKKELIAVRRSLERPSLVPSSNASQEAQFIAQKILVLRDEGMPLCEIAVLFRAAYHAQTLEFELMKRDIPYEYRGGLKFFERAHVKDIVSHLRIRQNPKDEVAWMRILGLLNGVGLASAETMASQFTDDGSLEEILNGNQKIPKRAQVGWEGLRKTLEKMAHEEAPAELIRMVTAGDYRDYLETEYLDFMDRLEDLEQFALFAEGYTSLQTFLDEVSLTGDYGFIKSNEVAPGFSPGEAAQEDRLILSTIHQAKGLEWDAVFVMHLVDGKFPIGAALDEDGGLEEERRLFYVATTRARKELFFTYPITSGYDTLMLSQPSMFLQELPEGLFEEVKLRKGVERYKGYKSFEEGWDDGPTIVFDDLGEREQKPMPKISFLRDIDEL